MFALRSDKLLKPPDDTGHARSLKQLDHHGTCVHDLRDKEDFRAACEPTRNIKRVRLTEHLRDQAGNHIRQITRNQDREIAFEEPSNRLYVKFDDFKPRSQGHVHFDLARDVVRTGEMMRATSIVEKQAAVPQAHTYCITRFPPQDADLSVRKHSRQPHHIDTRFGVDRKIPSE
ncbi:hypothetical protein WT27_09930 [Burkholderia territorii]|uniref:Uncharacterized protein n=1 Tax=Burkholderia territorii TaxID=1503055 RepID=A0A119DRI0_9BURK|nr:hypothetical protein WT27_09930 [Burkholderia territorii]KVX43930.1 hypothetical protein WT31_26355 [Burkholderia territorii]